MLKLDTKQEPFWLDILDGQKTQFLPVTTPMVLAARAHAAETHGLALEAGKDQKQAQLAAQEGFNRRIAQLGIVGWTGVVDAAGKEAKPTAENIDAYLSNWQVFDAIDAKYVIPAIVRTDEKNASSVSRNGTSAKAKRTAAAAAS